MEGKEEPDLQSLRKFVQALGQSSVYKSITRSPLLVSKRTDIGSQLRLPGSCLERGGNR